MNTLLSHGRLDVFILQVTGSSFSVARPRVCLALQEVADSDGILLWDRGDGRVGLLRKEVLLNALDLSKSGGPDFDIQYEQTLPLPSSTAELLLQYTKKFPEPPDPGDTSASGEGD